MTITTKSGGEPKKENKPGSETVVIDTAEKPGYVFGIRSHLHEFYDWRGLLDKNENGQDGWYLLPPSMSANRRRIIFIFRALTVLGLMLLVLGAVLILVGYMWPRESPASILRHLEQSDDGKFFIPDDIVNLFEDKMRPWKLAGLIVFASGGTILAISLLVPTCARLFGRETLSSDLNTPVEPPVKIFPATPPTLTSTISPTKVQMKKGGGSPPSSPTERRVPVVEEITTVQPKSKPGETGRRSSGDELLLMEENEQKRP